VSAMQDPDSELMSVYGTQAVYRDKLANRGPFVAALGPRLLGPALFQALEREAGGCADGGAFDEDGAKMARRVGRLLAKQAGLLGSVFSLANHAPNALARGAGQALKPVLSRTPGLGGGSWKQKALIGGVGLVGGYGALQAGKALYGAGMKPAPVKIQSGGRALPHAVNEWGVPT
jgi:hypothetical protein